MWTCGKCSETSDDDFDVCWQCGTSRDGSAASEDFISAVVCDEPTSTVMVGSTGMPDSPETTFGGFRPATVEPVATHAWAQGDRSRELRLFDKYLTWHYLNLGIEWFHLVPYRSISRLEYAVLDNRPVVFFVAGDLKLAVDGSQDEIAAIVERLAAVVS